MPEDLWSYKWLILRSLIALPALFFCFIIGLFKDNYEFRESISRFINWDFN